MASPKTASTPPYAAENHPPQPILIDQETQYQINQTDSDHSKSQPSPPLIELQSISAALSAFQASFDGLQLHLNTLKFTVENLIANNQSQVFKIATLSPSEHTQLPKIESLPQSVSRFDRELKVHCETMNGKGLKRYLVSDLKDIAKFRVEVPKELKFAPNAAKLVLECSGRFFLQRSKAYVKGSPMVTGREASVLILECFLLIEGWGKKKLIKLPCGGRRGYSVKGVFCKLVRLMHAVCYC